MFGLDFIRFLINLMLVFFTDTALFYDMMIVIFVSNNIRNFYCSSVSLFTTIFRFIKSVYIGIIGFDYKKTKWSMAIGTIVFIHFP